MPRSVTRLTTWFVTLATVLLVSSCQSTGPRGWRAHTPEGTFKRIQRVLRKKNFDAFFEMFSDQSKRYFVGQIREMGPAMRKELESKGLDPDSFLRMHPKQAFVRILRRGVELDADLFRRLTDARLAPPAEVDGSVATVRYHLPDEGGMAELSLVLENGQWRVDDF